MLHPTGPALALALALVGCTDPKGETDAPPDTGDAGGADGGGGDGPGALASGRHTLQHDGRDRSFLLHVPDDLPPGAPLVLAFHGYSSDASTLRQYAGLDGIADREGAVVAYPFGTEDDWGYRYFEVGYAFHDGSVDDVGFARALVDLLVASLDLDATRVYATGMSNGGDLSYKLACEADDVVAAVAPVAGAMMGSLVDACAPARAVPLLEIHGTADDVTLWDGDPDDEGGWGPYPSTEAGVLHFVGLHGLEDVTEEALPDTAPGDGSTVLARRWSGPAPTDAVWLYQVDGGGHDWPGAWGNRDIDASEEIWAFFSRLH